jgi:WhiB family redox-sensing transcriptional regulator
VTWHAQANCLGVDPEVFYPERGDMAAFRTAVAICQGCPVIEQCLEENMAEKDGIFGGLSGNQRREYRSVHGMRASCLHCGTEFRLRNTTSGFCSPECKKARHHQQKMESAARAWWSEA